MPPQWVHAPPMGNPGSATVGGMQTEVLTIREKMFGSMESIEKNFNDLSRYQGGGSLHGLTQMLWFNSRHSLFSPLTPIID